MKRLTSFPRPSMKRNRRGAAVGAVLTAVLTVSALLIAPHAALAIPVPITHYVTFVVKAGTEENSIVLPNVALSVRDAGGDGEPLAEGVTNSSGRVELAPTGDWENFEITASWLTAPESLTILEGIGDFADVKTVWITQSYASLEGQITALVAGVPLVDLSGAQVRVFTGEDHVADAAVSAEGTFTTEPLPRTYLGYRLELVPPAGYEMAPDASPQRPFEIDAISANPNVQQVAATFELVAEGGAAPTPTPSPTDTSEPTEPPSSTPTPTDTSSPSVSPTPTPSASGPDSDPDEDPITLGSNEGLNYQAPVGADTSLHGFLGDISEDDLDDLLDAAEGSNGPLFITNQVGQVLGLLDDAGPGNDVSDALQNLLSQNPEQSAQTPQASQSPDATSGEQNSQATPSASGSSSPSESSPASMSGSEPVVAAVDLNTLLQQIQVKRVSTLEELLSSQIQQVQDRNAQLGKFSELIADLEAYKADGAAKNFAKIMERLERAKAELGIEQSVIDPFAKSTNEREADAALAHIIAEAKLSVGDISDAQQMDMLRVQSLSNRQNDAFDLMNDFVKKMQEGRSSVVGNMRSTPLYLGRVESVNGQITGTLDVSQVEPGDHHLIAHYEDFGYTFIAETKVLGPQLANTGASQGQSIAFAALLTLAGSGLVCAAYRRRTTA